MTWVGTLNASGLILATLAMDESTSQPLLGPQSVKLEKSYD